MPEAARRRSARSTSPIAKAALKFKESDKDREETLTALNEFESTMKHHQQVQAAAVP